MPRNDNRVTRVRGRLAPPPPPRQYHAIRPRPDQSDEEARAAYGEERIGDNDVVFILRTIIAGPDGEETLWLPPEDGSRDAPPPEPWPRERPARQSAARQSLASPADDAPPPLDPPCPSP